MKLGLCFISCLTFLSCRTQSIHSDCLSRLQSDINKNWKFNVDSTFHLYDDGLTLRMDTSYKKCLIGLQVKDIVNLFGKPNDTIHFNTFVLKYRLSAPCTQQFFDCSYLLFEFNPDRTVKRFGVTFMGPGFPK